MLNNDPAAVSTESDPELRAFLDKYSQKKAENNPIPIDVSYDEHFAPYFNGTDIKPLAEPTKEKPGFLETVGHDIMKEGEITKAYTFASEKHEDSLPLFDPAPAGWNPKSDTSNMAGVWPKNQGRILSATGPKDQARRHFEVLDEQEKDEYYSNGSFFAHLIGGVAAYSPFFSPSSLIPLSMSLKYSKMSMPFVEGFAATSSGVTASSLIHNAWNQTVDQSGNFQDGIDGFYNDTIAGIALMGAGEGLGKIGAKTFDGFQVWNARGALKHVQNGIEAVPVLNAEGEMVRIMAKSNDAGAAQVKIAEDYYNSNMVKSGLFAVPIMGNMIGKGAAAFNPIFRMLNSEFPHVAGIIDRVADHGIVTEKNVMGYPSPIKFENVLDDYRADTTNTYMQVKALHLEANGIETSNPIANKVREMKASYSDSDYLTPEAFQQKINHVLFTEQSSDNTAVNEAAALLRPKIDEVYERYRQLNNYPVEILKPRTAEAYSMVVHDVNEMLNREGDWIDLVTSELTAQDNIIDSYMNPLDELRGVVKEAQKEHFQLVKNKDSTESQVKSSAENLSRMKRQLKRKKESLEDELRDNAKLDILMEDRGALSSKEARKLRTILKPVKEAAKKQKEFKEEINKLKFKKLSLEGKAGKIKDKEAASKKLSELESINAEIQSLEDKVNEFYHKEQDAKYKLEQDAHSGKISSLYFKKRPNGEIEFLDPKDRLKFRKRYKSNDHRRTEATAYYNTILNQSAEDTISQTMGSLLGRHGENHLKERSLLVRQEALAGANFLSKDLMANFANYRLMLARRIALIETFGKSDEFNSGWDNAVKGFHDDYMAKKEKINAKIESLRAKPSKDKSVKKELSSAENELKRLQKSFQSNKEDLQLTYEKMMGRTRGSKNAREYARMARNFAVSTKLGAVPLTMVTDLSAIGMKHGYWPTIRDGIIPSLQNISNLIKGGKGGDYEKTAKYALVGLTNNISATADRSWSGLAQPYTPLAGKLANGIESMAHISNTMAGTIMIDNAFQRWTASVVDAKIVRYMQDHLEGTLSEQNKLKCLVYGLDPKVWAKRIVDGWKASGKDGDGGAAISRYFEWPDKEAANMVASTIRRGVKDTVIRRGMFDAPFALDDPWIGTMFLFKGWLAASMTRFLLPLMQRPDAEKLVGTFVMLSMGALVTPLRRITKGQEPIQDGDHMYINAITDSGIFSAPMDLFETMNALSAGSLMGNSTNDRYHDRSIAGFLAGPLGQSATDISHVIRMAATGNINRRDIKKAVIQLPGSQPWYARAAWNKLIGSLNVPENYSEAQNR